ncbi:hypothetical protein [Humisphaera borealis]|uniref:Periplasmic heavy metal sensor n=1 Tax=Humisphaera borealis TaxID=2807512 RepID=A0A7M2X2K5_9BACT|nr:hypothetical protein [Humisphaera borealis]QOV91997.1 hypothetical protein IPV69_11840 [Humisphaera borealis]
MPRSLLRPAVLSAILVLVPSMTSLSIAADEPAPPPPAKEGAAPARPGEPRPQGRPEGRPEGRPDGEGRPLAGRMDPNAMIERVQGVLAGMDLSAEQKTKIDEAVAAAKKSIAGQKEGEPRERIQATMTAMGELRSSIEATLNEEQRKVFAEKVPARRPGEGRPGEGRPGEGRPEGGLGQARPGTPGAPGEGRGAMLTNALNAALEKTDLTADQKAKVKENFMAEIQKMIRDGGQRPGQRPNGDRPDGAPREGRPDGARPDGARPDGAKPEGQRPARPAQEI